MTGFVLDASVTVSWALRDEADAVGTEALARLRDDGAVVPSIWWLEVRNVLIMSERRGRLAESDTAAFLRSLSRLEIVIDHTPDEVMLLTLARRHRLNVYDAAYLELARREGMPLATLDTALAHAARQEKLVLLGSRGGRR